jgi:hypothetical protein
VVGEDRIRTKEILTFGRSGILKILSKESESAERDELVRWGSTELEESVTARFWYHFVWIEINLRGGPADENSK